MSGIYAPLDLNSQDYVLAQKPTLGGEKAVFLSREHAIEIGQFQFMGTNSGIWNPDPVNAPDQTSGNDLIAVVETRTGLNGGASNVVLTVNGLDSTAAPISATVTFKPPPYAKDQTKVFQVGYAVDVVQGANKKFKNITSIVATTAEAAAKGCKVTLFAMPALSTFTQVGCATDMRFNTKASIPVAIACGMDASAFTKPGRSERPDLSIGVKQFGFGDGIIKFDGIPCTGLVKVVKEGKIHTDNIYFLEMNVRVQPTLPDGEGEAMFDASGVFEDVAYLTAM